MATPHDANTTVHQGLGGPLSLYRYLGSRQPLYLQRNIRAVAPQVISEKDQKKESENHHDDDDGEAEKAQESTTRPSAVPDIKIPTQSYHRPRNGIDAKIRFHEIRLRVPRETYEDLFVPQVEPLHQTPPQEEDEDVKETADTNSSIATATANSSECSTSKKSDTTSTLTTANANGDPTVSKAAVATATTTASTNSASSTSFLPVAENADRSDEEMKENNYQHRRNPKRYRDHEQGSTQRKEVEEEEGEVKVPHTPWCYAIVSFLTRRSAVSKDTNKTTGEFDETETCENDPDDETDRMYVVHQHAAVFVPSKPWLESDAYREYIPQEGSNENACRTHRKASRKTPRHEILSYDSSEKMHREHAAMHDISFRTKHPSPVEQTLPSGVPCPRECFRINYDSVVEPVLSLKDAMDNLVDDDNCVRGTLLALPPESKTLKSLARALDGGRYNVIFVNSPDELCASRNFTFEQLSAPIRGVKRLHIGKFFDCPLDESLLADNEVTVRVSLVPRKAGSTYPNAAENGETNRRVPVPIPPEALVAATAMIPSVTMLRHLNGHMRNSECAARMALLGQLARASSNIHSSSLDPKFLHERILDFQKLGVGNSWRAAARMKDPTRLKCLASNAIMGQIPEKSESLQVLQLVPLSSEKIEDLISENLTYTIYQRLWSDALLYEQGKKGSSSLLWVITPSMLNTLGYPMFTVASKGIYSSKINCHKGRNRCFIRGHDFDWTKNNQESKMNPTQFPEISFCYSVQTLSVRNILSGVTQCLTEPYKSLLRVGRKCMSYSENTAPLCDAEGMNHGGVQGESRNHVFAWHFWSLRRDSREWCHMLQKMNKFCCALCMKLFMSEGELFLHLETNHYRCRIGIHDDIALPQNSKKNDITKGAVRILLAKSPFANSVRPQQSDKRFWHVHVVPPEHGPHLKNDLSTVINKEFVASLWFGEEARKKYKGHLVLNSELVNWRTWQLRTVREPVVRGHWVYHNPQLNLPQSTLEWKAKARAMIECDMPPELVNRSMQVSKPTVADLTRYPRQYFHSQTGQPIQPHEEDIDSDDEVKDRWVLERSSSVIDSFEDASAAEKKFMKLWNSHVFELGVYADRVVPRVCLLFARRFTSEISRQNLRFQFLLHMLTLWDFAILDTRTLHYCLRIVDSYRESQDRPSQLTKQRPSQLVLPFNPVTTTTTTTTQNSFGSGSSTPTSGDINSVDDDIDIEEEEEEEEEDAADITEIAS